MGTKGLTAVYIDGDYRISQYNQFDGYPDGQGLHVLQFIRDGMNESVFKKALRNSNYIGEKQLYDLWETYGARDGYVSLADSEKMKKDHPEFHRDTGARILEILQNHLEGMMLEDSISFAADSLCEWVWVIDLDKRTFEAYKGFNKRELTLDDRFYFLREYEDHNDKCHGVVLVGKWSLDSLPTDDKFLSHF